MIDAPSPHQSLRAGRTVRLVVIHGDAGKSDAGTLAWLKDPASMVSYHYLVGRDGTVYRCVPEGRKAWHAGKSAWKGLEVQGSVNACSIGVAFANDGTEPYRDAQYLAGAKLVREILDRYDLDGDDVVGHADVSPGRKTDPWKHFDWDRFGGLVATPPDAS